MWQTLIAFEVQVHLRRQGLSSPSEGEGFPSPGEVEDENEDENENEEEQDEDETQTGDDWGRMIEEKFCIFFRYRNSASYSGYFGLIQFSNIFLMFS